MSETTVNTLKINTLTKAQYETSSKSNTELWFVTDETVGLQQYSTMPTASASNVDEIAQFVGTSGTYINGYFYKCVTDGSTYFWAQMDVQPSSSGATWGSITGTLTDQTDLQTVLDAKQNALSAGSNIQISGNTISATDTTYTAGTGIDITDGVISNTQTSAEWGNITGTLSSQTDLQTELTTLQTEIDGLIPSQTGQADKFLTTDGTSTSWASLTKTPSTTPILTAAGWDSTAKTQTITVTEVTASNTVFVQPESSYASAYATAGILCTGQGSGTLSFSCDTIPDSDITLQITIL